MSSFPNDMPLYSLDSVFDEKILILLKLNLTVFLLQFLVPLKKSLPVPKSTSQDLSSLHPLYSVCN